MNDQIQNIPAGAVFTITKGEYSDYSIWATYRALVEITGEVFAELSAIVGERYYYMMGCPEGEEWWNYDQAVHFTTLLIERGLAEEIQNTEIHLGAPGTGFVRKAVVTFHHRGPEEPPA